jgi:hypothetical protein
MQTKMKEEFKVIAVSDNTNSFGLKQFYAVSRKGVTYRAHCTSQFCPKKDEVVSIPVILKDNKVVGYNLSAMGYEIPELLPSVSEQLLNEIWKTN